MVIKLDIAKAYPRVSWTLIAYVMRKLALQNHKLILFFGLYQMLGNLSILKMSEGGFFTS